MYQQLMGLQKVLKNIEGDKILDIASGQVLKTLLQYK